MCEFISVIKKDTDYFYLTKDDLKGKTFNKFKRYNKNWIVDICGHGAISFFYPEVTGEHWECTDFSTPKNFPVCIVEDIKNGNFAGIGVCPEILNQGGLKKYNKIKQPEWEKYNEIDRAARKKYNEIIQAEWEKYNEIDRAARKKYNEIKQAEWEKYNEIDRAAQEKYNEIEQAEWEKYNKIDRAAREKYNKIDRAERKKYNEIIQTTFWKIAKQAKYRKGEWK